MGCGHEIARARQHPARLVARAARPLPPLRRAHPDSLPSGRARHGPARRRLLRRLRRDARTPFSRPGSASSSSRSRRSTSSTGSSRTGSSCRQRRSSSSPQTALAAERRVAARRARRVRHSSSWRRSPTRRAWAWATSSSRCCSARCSGRRSTVALMIGFLAALVPSLVLLAPPRLEGAQDRDPVRPVPRLRGGRGALRRRRDPRLVPRHLRVAPRESRRPGNGVGAERSEPCRGASGVSSGCRYLVRGNSDMNFEPAGPLRTSTNLGDRAGTSPGGPEGSAASSRRSRISSRSSSRRPRSSPATGSLRPAAAPAPARSPRRSATRATRSPRASPDRSPGATACRSSTSRRSGSRRTRPSSCRCSPCSASSRSRSPAHGDRLRVAIADPGNIHGIDELRLASRYPVELGVASRDDILAEIGKIARRSEVIETQSALDDFDVVDETEDDLEVDDGVSDAPLVRLVNSIIMQAATDGASDIHFEPQEDCAARARARRRRAQRGAADPEADGERRHDPPEGAREARHRRAAQAAGRADLARGPGRRPHARHPRRGAARPSRASRS